MESCQKNYAFMVVLEKRNATEGTRSYTLPILFAPFHVLLIPSYVGLPIILVAKMNIGLVLSEGHF